MRVVSEDIFSDIKKVTITPEQIWVKYCALVQKNFAIEILYESTFSFFYAGPVLSTILH